MYKRFLWQGRGYACIAPKNSDDIVREGKELSHCVENYINDFSKGNTFIYFWRDINDIEIPFFTFEVKGDNHRIFELIQCYRYNDTTEKDDNCRKAIVEWARTKGIKIRCEV